MSDWKTKLANGGEEALTAAATTAIATVGVDAVSLFEVDWKLVAGASLLAGLLAFLRVLAVWNRGAEVGPKVVAKTPVPAVTPSEEDFSEFDEWPAEDA